MRVDIHDLIDRGALFYCSHSGGKDSQAMYTYLTRVIPASQLRVVHADLGDIEHAGVKQHIEQNIDGRDLLIARATHADGTPKDFFSAVRARREALDKAGRHDAPAFPSSAARFCTSDLKTGPIWKTIKADARTTDTRILVNCVGIRAEESPRRAKTIEARGTFNKNNKNSNGTWECYDWWPISDWPIQRVWDAIRDKGQFPHPAYANGNERLSCMFCIFGSVNDLQNARATNPALYERYLRLEQDARGTMFHTQSLADRLSVRFNPAPSQGALF